MFRKCVRNMFEVITRKLHEKFNPIVLENVFSLQKKNLPNSVMEKKMRNICEYYRNLDYDKNTFLITLASNYRTNLDDVRELLKQPQQDSDAVTMIKLQNQLRNDLVPSYNWLFKEIARHQSDGIKFLVDLRKDLLNSIQSEQKDTTLMCLQQLNKELKDLLSIWFCSGMLTIERVTWQSSCEIMEKISEYESVHPIRTWKDVKNRVGEDRRCFIYTHSSMLNEPLVILHTALRKEIPNSTDNLIKTSSKSDCTDFELKNPSVIVFYSITSTQAGLRQIDLGNCLIRQAIDEIRKEFPDITTFVTLSPIPQFRIWFKDQLKEYNALFTDKELRTLNTFFHCDTEEDMCQKLRIYLDTTSNNSWHKNPQFLDIIKEPLIRICAQYLVNEKKRGYAFNSVANFHLRNGAQVWRINWLADQSIRGLSNSFGLMVNYNYDLKMIDVNSQQYLEHKCINVTDSIKDLVENS